MLVEWPASAGVGQPDWFAPLLFTEPGGEGELNCFQAAQNQAADGAIAS